MGLVGVDIVEVVKLVAVVRPRRIPSTRKGITRVQKSHGLALTGFCLMMATRHHDACLALVLDHPIASVMRALF